METDTKGRWKTTQREREGPGEGNTSLGKWDTVIRKFQDI